jgi:GT2 family glycosyltransferase
MYLKFKIIVKKILNKLILYIKIQKNKTKIISKIQVESLQKKPLISVITPVYNIEKKYLVKCIESVRNQVYPNWELCLYDDSSTLKETLDTLEYYKNKDPRIKISYGKENLNISGASNKCVELSNGEYLSFLDNDDEIHRNALYFIVKCINENDNVDYIYTDEDKIDLKGNHFYPNFKPDYSLDFLHCVMYFLHFITIKKSIFIELGGFREKYTGAQDYDLALRVTRYTNKIFHIPEILYHWRMIPGSAAEIVDAKPSALVNAKNALKEHIEIITEGNGRVEQGFLPGTFRIRINHTGKEEITILIPTNYGSREVYNKGKINLIQNLIKSIIEKSTYKNIKIHVIDNGNSEKEDISFFDKYNISLFHFGYDKKNKFNFAQKANYCFSTTETKYVIFLNDDMEIITSDWIESLLDAIKIPGVGLVGAKLIYPDNKIQHSGILLHPKDHAIHINHGIPIEEIGYNGYTHFIRNYSAVTGACIMTEKNLIEMVGGFDEKLCIDFNDTDFCLKIGALGKRIVFTPYAQLYHFEQSSLPRSKRNEDETNYFINKWKTILDRDPFHNMNLL